MELDAIADRKLPMRQQRMRDIEDVLYFVLDERGHSVHLTDRGAEAMSPDKIVVDELEISASAVITGEIVAKILAIANGARIEGEVTVTSGKPILKFEEKRAG